MAGGGAHTRQKKTRTGKLTRHGRQRTEDVRGVVRGPRTHNDDTRKGNVVQGNTRVGCEVDKRTSPCKPTKVLNDDV